MHQIRVMLEKYWPYLVLGIFLIAAKFQLIALYGNATPFWDQWDAEADYLYRPWLEGTYDWKQLFSAHNEHRILTTRVLALLLLELNGEEWSPLLQMRVNACLHVAALCVLLFYLAKVVSGGQRVGLILFAGALFAIPFGQENTLAGFQSQFYFLLLFSFVFLWAMSAYSSYSKRWWMGFVAGLLCVFSMASGALTLMAGGLILAIRRFWFREGKSVALSAMVIIFGMALLSIHFTPSLAGHAAFKADSPTHMLKALLEIAAWPAKGYGGLVIVQLPLLLFVYKMVQGKTLHPPELRFVMAMAIWIVGQFTAIAYGRAGFGVLSSRYLDLFAVGLITNLAALLYLHSTTNDKFKKYLTLVIAVWLVVIVLGFVKSEPQLIEALRFKAESGTQQEKNVRAYLCSGEIEHLLDKPFLYIPYPDPIRLKNLLDNQAIRKLLPGNINEARSTKNISLDGEPYCNTGAAHRPYKMLKGAISQEAPGFAAASSITQSGWLGSDYYKSELPGYKVIGSFIGSEKDTGVAVLHVSRGQKILYRSGPRVSGQFILIDNGRAAAQFNTELPLAQDWTILEFTNPDLPEEFDVILMDVGTRWGEWSAIALRK